MQTNIAHRPIASVKTTDLIRIRDEWIKTLKPATIVRRFALLSHLYTVAIKDWCWSYLEYNPVQMMRKPSIRNERNRRLYQNIVIPGASSIEAPRNELDWIIKVTKSKTLPTIALLSVETAMRRSELVRLRREDINFDDGTIYIPTSKNGNPRMIPLSPLGRYIIINYLTKHNRDNNLFDIAPSSISKSFCRAVRKARCEYENLCLRKGIQPNPNIFSDLRFHDLRHEGTSRLAEIYEMHELARITGHSDTRMLLRYYHPDVEKLSHKLAASSLGQQQFNSINQLLLQML